MSFPIQRALASLPLVIALLLPWSTQAQPGPLVSEQLQRKAADLFEKGPPGGVVLVRKGDDILLRQAYGLADVENGVAMKPESVFRLASSSKQFTAVAVLQLVQAGKLKLDQALGEVYREAPKTLAAISLRQLLNHTSGIKNISRIPASRAARRQEASVDELLAYFKDLPLEFAPGSQFSYSNSNYIVLTKLIELASGKSYADYMQHAIFAPLGMKQTRYGSHLTIVPNRAQGYQEQDGELMNADFISMTQPQGAGGLITSVDDLNRWDQALYGEQLVSQGLLAQAFTKVKLADGSEAPYGFGWMLSQVQGQGSVEHSGFINGFQSYTLRMPAQKIYVTVLTNAEFLDPSDLAVELAAIALGQPYDKTPIQTGEYAQWLGRYDFGQGVQRDFLRKDGKLYSQRLGAEALELVASKDGRYYFAQGLNYLSFARRGDGQAQMTVHDRLMGDSAGVALARPVAAK